MLYTIIRARSFDTSIGTTVIFYLCGCYLCIPIEREKKERKKERQNKEKKKKRWGERRKRERE